MPSNATIRRGECTTSLARASRPSVAPDQAVPQLKTAPSSVTHIEWRSPALALVTRSWARAATRVGRRKCWPNTGPKPPGPWPHCPNAWSPNENRAPLAVTASECSSPAAQCTTRWCVARGSSAQTSLGTSTSRMSPCPNIPPVVPPAVCSCEP
eukprot:scaffold90721_cov30-Tisochrysis_lutea.AAC.3